MKLSTIEKLIFSLATVILFGLLTVICWGIATIFQHSSTLINSFVELKPAFFICFLAGAFVWKVSETFIKKSIIQKIVVRRELKKSSLRAKDTLNKMYQRRNKVSSESPAQ